MIAVAAVLCLYVSEKQNLIQFHTMAITALTNLILRAEKISCHDDSTVSIQLEKFERLSGRLFEY